MRARKTYTRIIFRIFLYNSNLRCECLVTMINKSYRYYYDAKIPIKLHIKTRMATFIKTKFKISDNQTNIDKYRLAANITEYHIISKLINKESLFQN